MAKQATGECENTDQSFVHLHLHSHYSLLDGGNRIDRLIDHVKALGMSAVAITDHGNLHGTIEFYTHAKSAGIKPILGIEAYVAPDINGKSSDRRCREYTGVADGGFHLVLLAENNTGWRNLLKLSSDSFINGFYYKPRMDKTTLEEHHDGLIAINGHLGSSIAYHLGRFVQTKDEAHYRNACEEARWHQQTFACYQAGRPRFYIELQRHDIPEQDQITPHLIQLAHELDIPLVCDNDAHFLVEQDYDAHDSLCCISTGKLKSDANRLHYSPQLYVKSPKQMAELFADLPEAVRNTAEIADRCNVELDFNVSHAPIVKIEKHKPRELTSHIKSLTEGSTDWYKAYSSQYELLPYDATRHKESTKKLKQQCDQALRELAEAGLTWRYGSKGVTDEHRNRLERELGILADKSISAYFLIVWDFVNEARRRGIPANARGSGVGTMVGYCLGLSNACPVRYGLLFERFTDPDRSEYPDIDIDICQDGRQAIIDYVRQKYGHVAQIITFGTLKARAAIRDVGRVLDVPLGEVDRVCKLVGDSLGMTIRKALDQEPDLQKLYQESDQYRQMLDTAMRLEGLARHAGVHAAGVVIATQPLDNIIPLYKPPGTEQIVTQWDGPAVEKVGLLKMDFLGLRTLSIIERARQLVLRSLDDITIRNTINPARVDDPDWQPLDLDRLTYDDPKVLDLFARGETAGVFQFESGGMRNLLMAMRPDRLEDLIAANALYRPGPMELIPNYNNRKHGREAVPHVHPIVDKLTADTYGIMVYQEQVMQIANELGGIPLRAAYTLIKAISKKKSKVIDAERPKFIEGAMKHGLTAKQSEELFDLILKFAGYGFNKSHSTGYAIIAYQTAYLKTYFPLQYMAAVLTYESVNTDKVVEYIDECRHVMLPSGDRGIEVRPPAINLSDIAFTVVYDTDDAHDASHGHIRFGLSAVKGVGEKAVNTILAERRENGPFRSLFDFAERLPAGTVNRSTIEALIKCGAFDELHGSEKRAAMIESLDEVIRAGAQAASLQQSEDFLFGEVAQQQRSGEPEQEVFRLPDTNPWSTNEQLEYERGALGFYVSSHPLDQYHELIRRYSSCDLVQMKTLTGEYPVIAGGMLTRVRNTIVKKGKSAGRKMAMLTLDDGRSSIEAVVFSDVYDINYPLLSENKIVFLKGRIDLRREEPGIIVDRVIPVEQAVEQLTTQVRLQIQTGPDAALENGFTEQLRHLRELFRQASLQTQQNGGTAGGEVVFELVQNSCSVSLRLNGIRVSVNDDLVGSISHIIERAGDDIKTTCTLLGPPKINEQIAQPHAASLQPAAVG